MYRQVQCLYCPSGCRHRLRSRPCTHGPGAAASLQVSARTRAPFSRAPGLGDTGGMRALSLPHGCPPTALAGWEPTQPEGTCSATLSGNKPAAAERPRGPARGTARPAGTVGTWGGQASAREPREAGRGRRGAGSGARGQFAAPLLGYLRAGGQRALARPPPATDAVLRRARPRWSWESVGGAGTGLGIPPSPARGTSRWDGDGMGRGSARTLSPPSCRLPARRAPAPLKGALRGPTAHGGAARGSAAENTGTSP